MFRIAPLALCLLQAAADANGADGKGFVGLHPGRFSGKVCLVTGSTSGLGEITAYHLAQEGCAVVVTGRREEKGRQVVKQIEALSTSELKPAAAFVKVDLMKSAEHTAMIDFVNSTYGRLDAVFANAGGGSVGSMTSITDADIDYTIDLNLKGTMYTIREAAKLLKETADGKEGHGLGTLGMTAGVPHGGSIVLCSSIFGSRGQSLVGAYAAAKHGLAGLMKAAVGDLSDLNIRVNMVSPAFAPSDSTAPLLAVQSGRELIGELQPRGKLLQPGQVAASVAYLLSADAGFINGVDLPIDGGMINHMMPDAAWTKGFTKVFAEMGAAAKTSESSENKNASEL